MFNDISTLVNLAHGWGKVVVLKGQKWITKRDVRYTTVYIYGNTDTNGYR